MPIINRQDAADVEEQFKSIFAVDQSRRAGELRKLFVEKLDFEPISGFVSLANAPKGVALPGQAERLASMSGVTVVYVPLDTPETDRVRKAEAAAAAKLVSDELGDDILLVMTNSSASQIHFIYPTFYGARPSLRRMVVERDLPRRTVVQQLSNWYWDYAKAKDLRGALERAFNVEAVTKVFFEKYKDVFDSVITIVEGFGESEEEQEAKKLFVQTLFNRLMFVYFLSRKGWLTFNGDKDYLNALWNDYPARSEDKNFYSNRLIPLFFTGLNNPRSSDLMRDNPAMHDLIGDVPFLNGGLFDQWDGDGRADVVVPDDAIQMILRDLFERFNFTVMESTPLDLEVAVDPEMLGKVFEELVTGRHETGSYYTPRPIVAFMSREALKGYLQGEVPELTAETVHRFVDERDVSSLNFGTAGQVREALEKVTVLDPACGSGAYLVGMLQELVELETALYSERLVHDPHSLYELKLRIIEQNLYGADIDPFAVNIAMLRLWLSLAIDYEGDRPEPLPNLDFKIVCGDSLTSPDPAPEYQLGLFVDRARGLRERLEAAKARFMTAIGSEKNLARQQIREMESELGEALADRAVDDSSLDWRVQFAEVFDRSGGFDIVIANPPYRRQEGLGSRKADLEKLYPEVYASTADYHVYFYNRSVQLLREGGELSFITNNKYMRAAYRENIRGFLPSTLTLGKVIDFGDLPIFKAASYPAIVVGRKAKPPEGHALQVADLAIPVRRAIRAEGKPVTVESVCRSLEQMVTFIQKSGVPSYPQALLKNTGWVLEDPRLINLFHRLLDSGTPLGELVGNKIYRGITSGHNGAFVINEGKRQELIETDQRSAEIIKPWLRGRDIKRWRAEWAELYVIFTRRGVNIRDYPAILAHLEQYRHAAVDSVGNVVKGLEPRGGRDYRKRGSYEWYEIQDNIAYYKEFAQPKVIWKKTSFRPAFQFDSTGTYLGNTVHFIPGTGAWLAAVMNSTIMEFIMVLRTNLLRGGYIELTPTRIDFFPIPNLCSEQKKQLEQLSHEAGVGEAGAEEAIDACVGQAFSLRSQEIDSIRKYLATRWSFGPGEEGEEEDAADE